MAEFSDEQVAEAYEAYLRMSVGRDESYDRFFPELSLEEFRDGSDLLTRSYFSGSDRLFWSNVSMAERYKRSRNRPPEDNARKLEKPSGGADSGNLGFGHADAEHARLDIRNRRSQDATKQLILVANIYTSGDQNEGFRLQDALNQFAADFGYSIFDGDKPVEGSWFRRVYLRFAASLGSPTAQKAIIEMQAALMGVLQEKQAANEAAQVTSAAALIAAVKDQKEAVIVVSRLLLVKYEDRLVVTEISVQLAERLRYDQSLAKNPLEILRLLQEEKDSGKAEEHALVRVVGEAEGTFQRNRLLRRMFDAQEEKPDDPDQAPAIEF